MDNQVKNNFKNKKFASLEYLSNEKTWAEDSNNLGLYFFLIDLKGKDTSEIFKKILQIKGSHASSYSYLGDIASELFVYPNERKIPTYYFKEALKHNDRDTHVLWRLFLLTTDSSYFLTAIRINYEAKKFDLVSHNLFNTYAPHLIEAKFDEIDWKELKGICLDENVEGYHELLLICCFYLEEFEYGINVMNKKEQVSKCIIDLYLDKGCIDFEYANQKSYYFERIKYLEGDFNRIYEEVKKEATKGNVNPTKEVLIKCAFEAKEYNDVISLIETNLEEQKKIDNQLRLYHILSSLYLGIDLNEEYEVAVNKQNFFRKSSCNPLYLAYLILRNIKALETYLVEKEDLHPIGHWGLYQEAEEYLSHDDLLNHYMHDPLVGMLKSLKDKWDLHIINIEIKKLKSIDKPLSETDKTRLASHFIDTSRHDEAILLLPELEPSMSVTNMLAVYYEKQGEVDTALTHYKSAIDSMKFNGELNDG